MVRLASHKDRPQNGQSSQPLSLPEKPRFFPVESNETNGSERKVTRLDEFQPRWWGNVQLSTQ